MTIYFDPNGLPMDYGKFRQDEANHKVEKDVWRAGYVGDKHSYEPRPYKSSGKEKAATIVGGLLTLGIGLGIGYLVSDRVKKILSGEEKRPVAEINGKKRDHVFTDYRRADVLSKDGIQQMIRNNEVHEMGTGAYVLDSPNSRFIMIPQGKDGKLDYANASVKIVYNPKDGSKVDAQTLKRMAAAYIVGYQTIQKMMADEGFTNMILVLNWDETGNPKLRLINDEGINTLLDDGRGWEVKLANPESKSIKDIFETKDDLLGQAQSQKKKKGKGTYAEPPRKDSSSSVEEVYHTPSGMTFTRPRADSPPERSREEQMGAWKTFREAEMVDDGDPRDLRVPQGWRRPDRSTDRKDDNGSGLGL